MNRTSDVRKFLNDTLKGMEKGELTNAQVRARLLAARVYIDTVKVDIAAVNLGKSIKSLTFDNK